MDYKSVVEKQKQFFTTQTTKNTDWRKLQLRKLRRLIISNEKKLYEAINKDFGKSEFDTYSTEIAFVLKDIDYYNKNLRKLAKPKLKKTNWVNLPGTSHVYAEPLGATLVIGAWNYPYQLSLSPMIAAIAAGNTVILKPSEIAENTMNLMAEIINKNFEPEFLYVAVGGIETSTALLELKFDKIFFTGSPKVGKIVYEAAAKHLTPVTLELGGKSPAIVSSFANLDVAAKRIVWGKFLNAGQTCVAPDYIYVDEGIKEQLIEKLIFYIKKFSYEEHSDHYTKIINRKNFERLINMIVKEKVCFGGTNNPENLYLQPTLIKDADWNDDVMQEEIFGPILPILAYHSFSDMVREIASRDKPLAAYIFTSDSTEKNIFLNEISFGGGCINDTIMHLSNDNLPFGGVGNSGIGNYHGKYGFETFSHQKAVLSRATWGEPNLKYPPYSIEKLKLIKKFL